MPVPFNTHEVVQELQDLGFPREQAEGLTAVLRRTAQTSQEQLATKLDLAEVKATLTADIAELKTDIATVRTDMEKMRGDLRAEIRDAKNSAHHVDHWRVGHALCAGLWPALYTHPAWPETLRRQESHGSPYPPERRQVVRLY